MVFLSVRMRFIFLGLACLGATGCGARSLPFTEPVEGTVMFNQNPVVGARVQFVPVIETDANAPASSAVTDGNGYFRLLRDDNGKPGAVVGRHKVVVVAGRVGDRPRSRDEEGTTSQLGTNIPLVYSKVNRTPLEVEVKQDETTYAIVLKEYGPMGAR